MFWAISPLLVVLGFSLVFCLVGIGCLFVIPYHFSPYTWPASASYSFVGFCTLNLVVRYVFALGTNPGDVHSTAYRKAVQARKDYHVDSVLLEWSKCRKSGADKPPRSHFDNVAKKLVMNFDHWCPWLFNSVGYLNYRHFWSFLLWVWMLTSFGSVIACKPFLEDLKHGKSHAYESVSYMLVFCLCSVLSVTVAILLGWHVFLSLSAQTGVDFQVLRARRLRVDPDFPNPFDSGCAITNLKQVVLSQKKWGLLELVVPLDPSALPRGKPFPNAW